MLIEIPNHMPLINMLLSWLDITLTYYIMFMRQKKGVFDPDDELGFLGNLIFKVYKGPKPIGYMGGGLLSVMIIGIVSNISPEASVIMPGVYLIIFWEHYLNIISHIRFWNIEKVWEARRNYNIILKEAKYNETGNT